MKAAAAHKKLLALALAQPGAFEDPAVRARQGRLGELPIRRRSRRKNCRKAADSRPGKQAPPFGTNSEASPPDRNRHPIGR